MILSSAPAVAEVLPYRLRFRFGVALIRHLIEAASLVTEIHPATIIGPQRTRRVAYVRFAIMAVARECQKSLPQIAHELGRSDHTTVIHGLAQAKRLEREDPDFATLARFLRNEADKSLSAPSPSMLKEGK